MNNYFKCKSAVIPIIIREKNSIIEILLHRRINTGYMDGYWDCAGSGHVEANESVLSATIREVYEEVGIVVKEENVNFAHVIHKVSEDIDKTYYNFYFVIKEFENDPKIKEPDKCSELKWFNINKLPEDTIFDRKIVIEKYLNGIFYSDIKV